MRDNIRQLKNLLPSVDSETEQNILRSIILFSCSGIDATVKQLIMEALEPVIERDEGAQAQLRTYAQRKLKNGSEVNYALLSELFTAKNSRKVLIGMLRKELSFDSLQSSDQLYRVASYFNISTERLVSRDNRDKLKDAFKTRNRIAHQMDIDFELEEIEYFRHDVSEVDQIVETIDTVAQNFIDEVSKILEKRVTSDFAPSISVDDGIMIINDLDI